MLKISSPLLRTCLLALLLPVLLLLPTFHTHPEQHHAHGHESTPATRRLSMRISSSRHPMTMTSMTQLITPRMNTPQGRFPQHPLRAAPTELWSARRDPRHLPLAPPTALPVNTRQPSSVSWACQPDHPPAGESACLPPFLLVLPPITYRFPYPTVVYPLKTEWTSAWGAPAIPQEVVSLL